MRMYQRPVGDSSLYLNLASYGEVQADTEGFEWVEGEPPEGAQPYVEKGRADVLKEIFAALPASTRALFGPLKAAVRDAVEDDDWEVVKLIIETAPVPPDLEPVRKSMLEKLS